MASDPSEFGDEAAGDELRGVSGISREETMVWLRIEGRVDEKYCRDEGDGEK